MRSNVDGAEGTPKEAKGGRGRAKGCAGVFLESYNSTKHNPRVNLTSPGGASWMPKKGTVEKKRSSQVWSDEEGESILDSALLSLEQKGQRVVAWGRRADRTAGDRHTGRPGEGQRMREKKRERQRGRAVGPGLAPLRSFFSLAQRLTGIFCRPNREDVKLL